MIQDCLLGTDFLKENGGVVDLVDGMLHCGGGMTLLQYQSQPPDFCHLALENTVVESSECQGSRGCFSLGRGLNQTPSSYGQSSFKALPSWAGTFTCGRRIGWSGESLWGSFCPITGMWCTNQGVCRNLLTAATFQLRKLGDFVLASPSLKVELELEKLSLCPEEIKKRELNKIVLVNFSVSGSHLGKADVVYHRIDTGDSAPIHQRRMQLSPNHWKEVENLVQDMQEKGVVQPSHWP